jgi:hypothetical protein
MAKYDGNGAVYTTDDLIRMAGLESFGQYSAMIGRALLRLKSYESENKQLKALVTQLKNDIESRTDGQVVEKLL